MVINKHIKKNPKLCKSFSEYKDMMINMNESSLLNENDNLFIEERIKAIEIARSYHINFDSVIANSDDEKIQVLEIIESIINSGMIKNHQRGLKINLILK